MRCKYCEEEINEEQAEAWGWLPVTCEDCNDEFCAGHVAGEQFQENCEKAEDSNGDIDYPSQPENDDEAFIDGFNEGINWRKEVLFQSRKWR